MTSKPMTYNTPIEEIEWLSPDVFKVVKTEMLRLEKRLVAGELSKLCGRDLAGIKKVFFDKKQYKAFKNNIKTLGDQINGGHVLEVSDSGEVVEDTAKSDKQENYFTKNFEKKYQEAMSLSWDEIAEYLTIAGLNGGQIKAIKAQVEAYILNDREIPKGTKLEITSGDFYEYGCQTDTELGKGKGIGEKAIDGINVFCTDLVDKQLEATGLWTSEKQTEEAKGKRIKVGAPKFGLEENEQATTRKDRMSLRTVVSGKPLGFTSPIEDLCLRFDTWHAMKKWDMNIVGDVKGHGVESLITPKNGLHWARIADLVQSICNNPEALALMPYMTEELAFLEQVGAEPGMYAGLGGSGGSSRSCGPKLKPANGFVHTDDNKDDDDKDDDDNFPTGGGGSYSADARKLKTAELPQKISALDDNKKARLMAVVDNVTAFKNKLKTLCINAKETLSDLFIEPMVGSEA